MKSREQNRFDSLFYSIPGAWAGSGPFTPISNTAHVTVATKELHNAFVFLARRRCRIVTANEHPAGHCLAGGTNLTFVILLPERRQTGEADAIRP